MKTRIEKLIKLTEKYNSKLVAVSKTVDIEKINTAINFGIKSIGENKVQELEYKNNILHPVEKRFIGHLQTNKIKKIIKIADTIDTIDSIKLAKKIDTELKKESIKKDVLIQINISEEETKSGFKYYEIIENFESLLTLSNLNIKGLMTIASKTNDNKKIKNDFKKTRQLLNELQKKFSPSEYFKELSMGMSSDFKIALDEGSTMIRVGSYIFGDRNYL